MDRRPTLSDPQKKKGIVMEEYPIPPHTHADWPVAELVEELRRGDIPAMLTITEEGAATCTLDIDTPGGERWQWICGEDLFVNDPGWVFDVVRDGFSVLDIPWQIRQVGREHGHPNPTTEDSAREVAAWLMTAINDMHGDRPAFAP
jgi:hypothetical protein